MAVSTTLDSGIRSGRDTVGGQFVRRGTINLGTYATSGITVTRSNLELWHSINDLEIAPTGGYVPSVTTMTPASCVVQVYRQKDPAAAGGADIALPEVANGVDLSAVNFRFRAEGR